MTLPAFQFKFDVQAETLALARQTRRTIQVAHGLSVAGRVVALEGLEGSVGLLCARVLDLPPAQGSALRAELQQLARDLESLDRLLEHRVAEARPEPSPRSAL